jgi:4-hydroxythreonine-4-phosphate dehydrogenase
MTLSSRRTVRVGITMGDPAGIGPEVIARSLAQLPESAQYLLIGDAGVLFRYLKARRLPRHVAILDCANVNARNLQPGRICAAYGNASLEYVDRALDLCLRGQLDALVTAPLSKEAVCLGGQADFRGHTEYLARACGVAQPVMMLMNRACKIVMATRHIPLSQVSRTLDPGEIAHAVMTAAALLPKEFGIRAPRFVVCGLNPHASDHGIIGKEEAQVVQPLVLKLRSRLTRKGCTIEGPLAADAALSAAVCGRYDCAVAMYHDQALIALKVSHADSGVNVTLGLPFVRTSPLHGTAFDIAGRGIARADSHLAAVRTAVSCAQKKLLARKS